MWSVVVRPFVLCMGEVETETPQNCLCTCVYTSSVCVSVRCAVYVTVLYVTVLHPGSLD